MNYVECKTQSILIHNSPSAYEARSFSIVWWTTCFIVHVRTLTFSHPKNLCFVNYIWFLAEDEARRFMGFLFNRYILHHHSPLTSTCSCNYNYHINVCLCISYFLHCCTFYSCWGWGCWSCWSWGAVSSTWQLSIMRLGRMTVWLLSLHHLRTVLRSHSFKLLLHNL